MNEHKLRDDHDDIIINFSPSEKQLFEKAKQHADSDYAHWLESDENIRTRDVAKWSAFNFAKKEAAREYWQQQSVDVDKFKDKFSDHCDFDGIVLSDREFDSILKFFDFNLQPKSDAVEFAEWIRTQGGLKGRPLYKYEGKDIAVSELYTIFKQSKLQKEGSNG